MIRAIITDIEGTTSSIAFVKDVLFPFARRALPAFVAQHGREPDVRRWLDAAALDIGGTVADEHLVEILQQWIDEDRKHTALKALQGMIWRNGYAHAEFHAHVYPDVPPALHAWRTADIELYVYSSGSVAAQRLFFAHTEAGDLSTWFAGFFDTEIGGKREPASYRNILEHIGASAADTLFLSDVVAELDAARETGMHTCLLDRPEDYPEPRLGFAANGHPRACDFSQIKPECI